MPRNSEAYNGWSNYETWCFHLWITSDEGTYNYWMEQAAEAKADTYDEDDDEEERKYRAENRLADILKEQANEPVGSLIPDDLGLYKDLVQRALGRIDYNEVARALLEE